MPLSQPHADTMEPDDTGPDTDRRVCTGVCVCVCGGPVRATGKRMCEVNGTRWRRSGLSGRLQFLGNTCLSSSAPLHACVHTCVCNPRVYLATAYMTLSCYCKTARSVTHHLLRIQGHREKHITFGPKFQWVLLLTLKYAAFTSPKDVLVIWRTENVSGGVFLEGADEGDMAMRGAGLAKAEKGC